MDRLDILEAKIAIRDKIMEYSVAMDRCNKKVGYNVFTEDSQLNLPNYQGSGKGFVDMCCVNHLYLECTNHWMPETLVYIDSETEAHSMTYGGNFYNSPKEETGAQTGGGSWCRYYDKWRKEADGQWRIYCREATYEVMMQYPVDCPWELAQGTRDETDIHYRFFPEHKQD